MFIDLLIMNLIICWEIKLIENWCKLIKNDIKFNKTISEQINLF